MSSQIGKPSHNIKCRLCTDTQFIAIGWKRTCTYSLLLYFSLKMEVARSSSTLVFCHITVWCRNTDEHDLNELRKPYP
jgi:hypothetical protein